MSRFVILGALLVTQLGVHAHSADPRAMNVLFIAIDDLNSYPTVMRDYPGVVTPNFERFAGSALTFTSAYCPGTMCNPSRSAIMSGVAPYRSGVYQNGQQWRDSPLLMSAKTLPQAFRDSGYHTMGCGKLYHSNPSPKQWAAQWDDDAGGQGKFAPVAKPNPIPDSVRKPGLFNYGVVDESQVSDFQLIPYAERRLAASYDKPFFMAHGIRYPHNPWVVPQQFLDLYPEPTTAFPPPGYKEDDLDDLPQVAREYAQKPVELEQLRAAGHWKPVLRHYLASVSAADEVFGRVLKALDDSEHADNTIVVVWADHGFHMGEKDHFAKYALWEQTTNVLLMVRVPGMTTPGARCNRTVSLQDLYPTLIDLCGLDEPGHEIDGRSIAPLLADPEAAWPYHALTSHMRGDFAVRSEAFRYIRYHDDSEELYDSQADPHEWTNLASSPAYAAEIDHLRGHLPKHAAERPPATEKPKGKRKAKRQQRQAAES